MTPISLRRSARHAFAWWLAALVLCTALGPVVSGALLQRAASAVAAECLMHAAHGMACEAGEGDAVPAAGHGHCGLCLVASHPPVLEAPPRLDALPAATLGGRVARAAVSAPAPDRARRWMAHRQHAPPA
jgi:hypothetical protein